MIFRIRWDSWSENGASTNFSGADGSVAGVLLMTPASHLTWCPFHLLPSDAEAACVSRFCLFSLASLEVAFDASEAYAMLVEREHSDSWRWALVGPDDFVIDSGSEATSVRAKAAAETALQMQIASATALANG